MSTTPSAILLSTAQFLNSVDLKKYSSLFAQSGHHIAPPKSTAAYAGDTPRRGLPDVKPPFAEATLFVTLSRSIDHWPHPRPSLSLPTKSGFSGEFSFFATRLTVNVSLRVVLSLS